MDKATKTTKATKTAPPADTEAENLAKALGVAVPEELPEMPKAETPPPAVPETPKAETPAAPETPKAETPAVPVEPSLEDILKSLESIPDPEVRQKTQEYFRKLLNEKQVSGKAKAWKAFDDDLKIRLPAIFEELAKKHTVELVNRRIVVTFPNGKLSHTNGVVGKGSGNGGKGSTGRTGFPEAWGEAFVGDQKANSPSGLAHTLSLQITGHRDMVDVFESQGYKVVELPACTRAEVAIAGSDADRAARLQGLVKEGGKFRIAKTA